MEFRIGSVAELISGIKSPQNNIGIKFESVQTPKEKTLNWKSNKNFSQKANKQMGSNVNVQSLQTSPKVNTPQRKHDNFSPRLNMEFRFGRVAELLSGMKPPKKNIGKKSKSVQNPKEKSLTRKPNKKISSKVNTTKIKHDIIFSPTYKQMENNANVQSENNIKEEIVSATPKIKHDKIFSPTYKQIGNNGNFQSENKIKEENVLATPKKNHDKNFSPVYKQMRNNDNVQSENKLKRSHNEEHVSATKRRKYSNINDVGNDGTVTINQTIQDENKLFNLKKRNKRQKWQKNRKRKIFVGNVPLNVEVSKVAEFFKPYGEVERVELQCAPVEFHGERTSQAVFVRFKEVDSTYKALEKNGAVFEGHRISVNLPTKQCISRGQRSVFLRRLPYETVVEEVWNLFRNCGKIQAVQIKRDPVRGVATGGGVICFQSPDAVEPALKLNGIRYRRKNIYVCQTMESRNYFLRLERRKREGRINDNIVEHCVNEDYISVEKSEIMKEDNVENNEEKEETEDEDYVQIENIYSRFSDQIQEEDDGYEEAAADDDGENSDDEADEVGGIENDRDDIEDNNEAEEFENVLYSKPERWKTNSVSKNASFQGHKVAKNKKLKKEKKNKSDRIKKVAINEFDHSSLLGFKIPELKKKKSDRIKKTAINKSASKSSPGFKKDKSHRMKKVAKKEIVLIGSSPEFKTPRFKEDKLDRIKKNAINKIASRSSPEFKKR